MKPDPEMYLAWSDVRPHYLDIGPETPRRVKISDRRSVRVFWIDSDGIYFHVHTRSHVRIRYECSAWKLTLLKRTINGDIDFDKFEGNLEDFNRDTVHAKMCGIFEEAKR